MSTNEIPETTTRHPGAMWKVITAGAAFAIIIVIVLIGSFQISGLRGEVNSQRTSLASQQTSIAGDAGLISQLQNKLGTLTTPQDPLQAYSDICNEQLTTNTSTGNTETYYFPCTNNVQTNPQPGS